MLQATVVTPPKVKNDENIQILNIASQGSPILGSVNVNHKSGGINLVSVDLETDYCEIGSLTTGENSSLLEIYATPSSCVKSITLSGSDGIAWDTPTVIEIKGVVWSLELLETELRITTLIS